MLQKLLGLLGLKKAPSPVPGQRVRRILPNVPAAAASTRTAPVGFGKPRGRGARSFGRV